MKIDNIIKDLPMNDHEEWGKRKLSNIEYIIIHHSAGYSTSKPRDTAMFHIAKHNYPGIAYHFEIPYCVVKNPVVYQLNYLKQWCYHTGAGYNQNGLGVLVRGGFHSLVEPDEKWTLPKPTDNQMEMLDVLVNYLREEFNVLSKNVIGHCHAGKSAKRACPGDFLKNWIEERWNNG